MSLSSSGLISCNASASPRPKHTFDLQPGRIDFYFSILYLSVSLINRIVNFSLDLILLSRSQTIPRGFSFGRCSTPEERGHQLQNPARVRLGWIRQNLPGLGNRPVVIEW